MCDVPETESAQIQVGQPTSLTVDALKGRTFPGRIARTAGVLDPRPRTLRVEAELLEHDPALRPGMFGMIGVTLSERSKALLLPSRGSRFHEKQPYAFCVNGRAVERRAVETGFTDGTRTEIVCGASPNDRVVLESRHSLHPGHSLQIANLRE